MRYLFLILSMSLGFLPHLAAAHTGWFGNIQSGGVVTAAVDYPVAGQAVQGAVVIRGSTAVEEFQSYEIDYSSTADPTLRWILVMQSTEPIQDGILAVWDTNNLSDGDYNLRLLINKLDGTQTEVTVLGLRVRNYTPMEAGTATPTVMYVTLGPGTPTSTPTPQDTLTPSMTPLPPTPTPLPVNPAEITAPQVMSTFGKGAVLSVGLLLLLGAYIALRNYLHNHQ